MNQNEIGITDSQDNCIKVDEKGRIISLPDELLDQIVEQVVDRMIERGLVLSQNI
jgi:uncharacterized ubiquitin-like protein YukD